ncbi:ABC transporter substrate-binding protein [Agromyces sp. NPDC058064]|uniref:ABC transporter substrate-binding protein n=1 Tax=Agromyces sp. NPDC058064 TaxID=3346322 RepID=UPI0036DCE577
MMKKLLAGLGGMSLALAMAVGTIGPAQAAPPPTANARQLATVQPAAITQDVTDAAGNVLGTFTGTFTPTDFTSQRGTLTVEGLINGTLTDAAGTVLATVTNQLTSTEVLGAAAAQACDILNLDLGPLHLDILGLVVDLSDVQLDITAQEGPGNLLGNLLCAVAGLLDRGGSGGLGNLLNRLLGL